jgi:GNAT superfamily N-acetyltransferase
MIIESKLEAPYESLANKEIVWFACDYCATEFQREKKVRERGLDKCPKDSCGAKDCRNKKKAEGYFLRFGVTHNSQLADVKAKKIVKIKEKMPETLKKMKKTNLEKYGSEFASQTDAVKEKMKQTCISVYGTVSSLLNEEVKEKTKATNIKNFGVEFPMQSEQVKAKREETNIERFGVPHASQADEVKNKIIESNLARFSVPYAFQAQEIKEKIKETNLEKYGCENPLQNTNVNQKRKKTNKEKYGTEEMFESKHFKIKSKETCLEKYGTEYAGQNQEVIKKMMETNMEKYGVPAACMLAENRIYGKTQNEIKGWLNSFGFNFDTNRTILNGREIDLYDEQLKIGFEYCGLYWHNELSGEPKTRKYHWGKYKICDSKGVRLITIFEDEWVKRNTQCRNFIKSILNKNAIKIFGRKCEIRQIEKLEFQQFCDLYHIQGANKLAIICFGLFYNGEMIGGISLGKHHRGVQELILDRLCFKDDISVMGGSSKLFSACVKWAKENGYKSIGSWSDNRWSAGGVYKKLGFELIDDGKPDYSYVDITKKCRRRSKQSQRKPKGETRTEREICLEKGLVRIWDCGKKKWVFSIS